MPPRWVPPNDAPSRARALGPPDACCPVTGGGVQLHEALTRCWPCVPDMPRPKRDDWLALGGAGEGDRRGQSFKDFARPGPHRTFPTANSKTIYVVPIGSIEGFPPLESLLAVLEACYSLPVRALPTPIPAKEVRALERDLGGAGYGPQLETPAVRALLGKHKPRDAFALVGVTMEDLCCTAKGFDFLFGQADLDKGVGVFSFARYSDDAPSAGHGPAFLRRCAMVLCHEVGHLFGIKHCVYGLCLMNGSNHLEEAERRPFALCPLDLRKWRATVAAARLGASVELDLAARERNMLRWLEENGLEADAALARLRVAALEGGEPPVAAAAAAAAAAAVASSSEAVPSDGAAAVGNGPAPARPVATVLSAAQIKAAEAAAPSA